MSSGWVLNGGKGSGNSFDVNTIVTSSLNASGQPRLIYNRPTNTFIEDGATVVIDNAGNVVTDGGP